jgi:hypothetical protein
MMGWFSKKTKEELPKKAWNPKPAKVVSSNPWQKKQAKNLKASSRFADKGKD